LLCPHGLEGSDGVVIALGEEVAEAEKIASLCRIGLIAEHRLKRPDGARIIALAVIDQADVQPDAGHSRGEPLRSA